MSASFPPRVGRVGEGLFVGPEVDWRGRRLCRCVLLVNVVKSLSDVVGGSKLAYTYRIERRTNNYLQVQITSINTLSYRHQASYISNGFWCYRYLIEPMHSNGASDSNTGRTRHVKHHQNIATSTLSLHVDATYRLPLCCTYVSRTQLVFLAALCTCRLPEITKK